MKHRLPHGIDAVSSGWACTLQTTSGRHEMNVLFFYRGVESLGVGYLMSVLKAEGHEVRLLFDPGIDDNLYVRIPPLKFLNRHERLVAEAKRFDPDLVAFSCPSNLFPFVKQFMELLRPEVRAPFVIGGVHATILPDYVLETTPADYVCVGEGEETLKALANALREGSSTCVIPGLHAAGRGKPPSPVAPLVQHLDTLPFPDKESFFQAGCFRRRISVITSRGCPFHCNYCSNDLFFNLYGKTGRFLRQRSPANVVLELETLKELYPARSFWFCDDVFALSKSWLEEFVERYAAIGPLPFDCHLHPHAVDEDRISLLKRAGCRHIFMGVDSGDERMRYERMGRKISERHIRHACSRIQAQGIQLTVSAIFGLPDEGPNEMRKTLDLVADLRPNGTSAYIFYPFFGTALYAYAVAHGSLPPERIEWVKQGIGSYHHKSILKHPHAALADTYSKVASVYTRAPPWVRRFLDGLLRKQAFRSASLLYALLTPLLFPFVGITWVTDTVRMVWRANTRPRMRHRFRTPPAPGTHVEPGVP